jgi:hypothetical protein
LRCEQARHRFAASVEDPEAVAHVAGCQACFEVMEATDPLVTRLRAAIPLPQAAPDLTSAVLARWAPPRPTGARVLRGVTLTFALLVALLVEGLVGVAPGRLAGLAGTLVGLSQAATPWLVGLTTIRDSLLGVPVLVAGWLALTLGCLLLWLRLASSAPSWRSAR